MEHVTLAKLLGEILVHDCARLLFNAATKVQKRTRSLNLPRMRGSQGDSTPRLGVTGRLESSLLTTQRPGSGSQPLLLPLPKEIPALFEDV